MTSNEVDDETFCDGLLLACPRPDEDVGAGETKIVVQLPGSPKNERERGDRQVYSRSRGWGKEVVALEMVLPV